MKAKTIDLKGKEYACVPERVRLFREDCPRGKIETTPTIQDDGQILFKAFVTKDKSDVASADATGHSLGTNQGDKAFEKLETIAVGRALAMLGYLASGDIASGEEMQEFLKDKEEKKTKALEDVTEKLEAIKSLGELKAVWGNLSAEQKTNLEELKNKMKTKYESS